MVYRFNVSYSTLVVLWEEKEWYMEGRQGERQQHRKHRVKDKVQTHLSKLTAGKTRNAAWRDSHKVLLQDDSPAFWSNAPASKTRCVRLSAGHRKPLACARVPAVRLKKLTAQLILRLTLLSKAVNGWTKW
jgi:hypothetical protein